MGVYWRACIGVHVLVLMCDCIGVCLYRCVIVLVCACTCFTLVKFYKCTFANVENDEEFASFFLS